MSSLERLASISEPNLLGHITVKVPQDVRVESSTTLLLLLLLLLGLLLGLLELLSSILTKIIHTLLLLSLLGLARCGIEAHVVVCGRRLLLL